MKRVKDGDKEHKLYSNPNINLEIKYYNQLKSIFKEATGSEKADAKNELFQRRMAIVERIIEISNRAGVKQGELAVLLGMSGPQLSYYENGRGDFPIGVLFEIIQIFEPIPGVSLDYIIFGKSPVIIDKDIAEVLKGKSFKEKEQAVKLLKVHFGMD